MNKPWKWGLSPRRQVERQMLNSFPWLKNAVPIAPVLSLEPTNFVRTANTA